jgi:hypothetical protein
MSAYVSPMFREYSATVPQLYAYVAPMRVNFTGTEKRIFVDHKKNLSFSDVSRRRSNNYVHSRTASSEARRTDPAHRLEPDLQLFLGITAQLPMVSLARLSSEVSSPLLLLLPWYEGDLEPVGWDLVTPCVDTHMQHITYAVTHIAKNLAQLTIVRRQITVRNHRNITNTTALQRNCQV